MPQPHAPVDRQGQGAGSTDARVLVAYATRNGSTQGVAERIASTLRSLGRKVDLRRVDQVGALECYDAVVFGSPVYDGRWLPEADAFVSENAGALSQRALWLYSVGSFGDRQRFVGPMMKREPRGIAQLQDALDARDYRVFAGIIERRRWPLRGRLFFRAFGGRFGDRRDWGDIAVWAEGIATAVGTSSRR